MEPESSWPHSQKSATCPYAKPQKSSPPPPYFLMIHFNIILPSTPTSSKIFPLNLQVELGISHEIIRQVNLYSDRLQYFS